tara:strand:+ start:1200 stop:1397 length:198 start_codon:yes stop_codon:yes gene_type:complete
MIDGSKFSDEEIAANDHQTKLLEDLTSLVREIMLLDIKEVSPERLQKLQSMAIEMKPRRWFKESF